MRTDFVTGENLSADIGNLSSLRTLGFVDTSIQGTIPSEIGKLSNLGKPY
jgi:hypothetical protein